jgi:hypothetical protein
MGADKFLAFPISCFPICSTKKRIFLQWVTKVRSMELRGEYVNTFLHPIACFLLYKAKDLSAPLL